jgi:drug/metabolite transporter (DMT)-like permease
MYQLLVSTVFCLPLAPLAGPMLRDVTALSTASLLFQSVFVVAFTYVLWFWLMRRYPASGLSSFTFLSPVFGVLCGGLLLNEPLSINIFAALALIVAGLFVVNWQPRRIPPA